MKLFPSQQSHKAWTAEQLTAVATLQADLNVIDGPFGAAKVSHVLKADGTFGSNLDAMKTRKVDSNGNTMSAEEAVAIATLIGEHRWIFVVDGEGFPIDVLPATDEAFDKVYPARPESIAGTSVE